jgi:hypothetical protein
MDLDTEDPYRDGQRQRLLRQQMDRERQRLLERAQLARRAGPVALLTGIAILDAFRSFAVKVLCGELLPSAGFVVGACAVCGSLALAALLLALRALRTSKRVRASNWFAFAAVPVAVVGLFCWVYALLLATLLARPPLLAQ